MTCEYRVQITACDWDLIGNLEFQIGVLICRRHYEAIADPDAHTEIACVRLMGSHVVLTYQSRAS
jgi:hypothetical protein